MISRLEPSFIVSYNYRHLVPGEVLKQMQGRIINLHTSYLPYNRGSSPNFFSFLEDTPKGVTIHLMGEGLDTGDILCQKEVLMDEKTESFASSYDKLLQEMKTLFCENWDAIKAGKLSPKKQEGRGTYHRMKELDDIREQMPFTWDQNIAEFKRKWNEYKNDLD